MKNSSDNRIGSSFRDPSGFLFKQDGILYRQVNPDYQSGYDQLMTSGLYADLVAKGWLIKHEEIKDLSESRPDAYKVIKPEIIPFISYPYEWCFSQLKDAALLTLNILGAALDKGMILKDASAYNIQFQDGHPVLIDTLSFDIYHNGSPWEGYRQFCQHFLAPLALASRVDIRLTQLLRVYIDGIPLDLASELLPSNTRIGLSGLAMHIHMHARMQRQYSGDTSVKPSIIQLSKESLLKLINGLEQTIEGLKWKPKGTEWGEYYSATNYSSTALRLKGEIIGNWIQAVQPKTAWDLGANNGLFSRESSRREVMTIASDIDPAAVEKNYLTVKHAHEKNLLPLIIDLTNPSSSIGWANQERYSFNERGPVEMVMALALLHHLAISNNVPLDIIAQYFSSIGEWVIVEFVPKSDSQVKRLLATREDIFPNYTDDGFEAAFTKLFKIEDKKKIPQSDRTLYLMKIK